MNALPEACATTNMDGKPIMIKKGETGYYLMDENFNPTAYNTVFDIDEEVIEIMTCASMFGWDIPAVKNYEAS